MVMFLLFYNLSCESVGLVTFLDQNLAVTANLVCFCCSVSVLYILRSFGNKGSILRIKNSTAFVFSGEYIIISRITLQTCYSKGKSCCLSLVWGIAASGCQADLSKKTTICISMFLLLRLIPSNSTDISVSVLSFFPQLISSIGSSIESSIERIKNRFTIQMFIQCYYNCFSVFTIQHKPLRVQRYKKKLTYANLNTFFCKKRKKPLFLKKMQQKQYIYMVYILYKAHFRHVFVKKAD